MVDRIQITKANRIPPTADVSHYDELDETAKERFPDLLGGEFRVADPDLLAALTTHEYVKFTGYYRVQTTESKYTCQD